MTLPLFPLPQTEKTSDDYLTPSWVFSTMKIEFDLDVASPPWPTFVPARRKFTKTENGLSQPWEGRIWMNPPYSETSSWARRFMEHRNGVALVPFAKSQWFIDLWWDCDAIAVAPNHFSFDGGDIFLPVFFAAYSPTCVEAIGRLGAIRLRDHG